MWEASKGWLVGETPSGRGEEAPVTARYGSLGDRCRYRVAVSPESVARDLSCVTSRALVSSLALVDRRGMGGDGPRPSWECVFRARFNRSIARLLAPLAPLATLSRSAGAVGRKDPRAASKGVRSTAPNMAAPPPRRPIPWKSSNLTKWFFARLHGGVAFTKGQSIRRRWSYDIFTLLLSSCLSLSFSSLILRSFSSVVVSSCYQPSNFLFSTSTALSHLFYLSSSVSRIPSICSILICRAFSLRTNESSAITKRHDSTKMWESAML